MIGCAEAPRAPSPRGEGRILFAVFQNGSQANGGVESVTQVIEGLRETARLVVTNAETPTTKRWRQAGGKPMPACLPQRQQTCRAVFPHAG